MALPSFRDSFTPYVHDLQDRICAGLEAVDGSATFQEDAWERPGGGGGKTRVMANGAIVEKGGVNTSIVHGELPETAQKQFGVPHGWFYATGVSLVIHPKNPFVPTVHANFRYFELKDAPEGEVVDAWFAGGADLTPWYLFEEDAVHFHRVLADACAPFGETVYPLYKQHCDAYFTNHHRQETRGIGGLFFDYLREGVRGKSLQEHQRFTTAIGDVFLEAYMPIAERRKNTPYTDEHTYWHEIRRGRYAEFNLLHDKGTQFGLRTNGRTESILMSLPPRVRWDYLHVPAPGSPEAKLVEHLKPVDWLARG